MDSLASILFGNVDEEGQIDYNGLDEEVIQSLQHATVHGGDLLESLLPENSLDLGVEKTRTKEKLYDPVTPQDSEIQPQENAIDYFNIDELAADDQIVSIKYYQQGVNSVLNLKRSLTLPSLLPSRRSLTLDTDDDDYDGGFLENKQLLSVKRIPDTWRTSLETDTVIKTHQEMDIASLYPAFRKNEVLNFSQLFATKVNRRRKLHPKSHQVTNLVQPEFILEEDDRKAFEQPMPQIDHDRSLEAIDNWPQEKPRPRENTRSLPLIRKYEDAFDEKEEDIFARNIKVPAIEKKNIFAPLMIDTWEEDIIWDCDNSDSIPHIKTSERESQKSQQIFEQLQSEAWTDSIIWDIPEKQASPANDSHLDTRISNIYLGSASMGVKKKAQMLEMNDDIVKTQAASLGLDRFNVSSDVSYEPVSEGRDHRVRQTYGQLVVQHSLPALRLQMPYFKAKLTKSELRAFHRPSIQFSLDQEIKFSKVNTHKKHKSGINKIAEAMRNSKELTLKDNSNFILMEYSEEYPPVMSNIGMGSLLLNYYRKTDPSDTTVPKLDIGEPVILDVADASPFMNFGNVESGQILPAIFNNLIRAPLFMHAPKDSDFLVVRNTYKGKTKYYIREIRNLFVVGQTYPLQEVPGPHSRKITTTIKNRLQEFAELQRTGTNKGFWKSKSKNLPNEEQLRNMLTPEMICLYESMLVGQRHLLDSGYGNVGKSANGEDESDESKLSIEEQLAPWITTRNFLNATQNKAMLKLHGDGDPTGIDEGFSFIRVSMKDIFLKQGETAEDKQAEIDKLPKTAHKYSVAEQHQRYQEEIDRIWNAQYASLSNKKEIPDELEQSETSIDKHYRQTQADAIEENLYSSPSSPSMFSTGDMEDNYSIDGSMGSRASYAYGSHRNRKLTIKHTMRKGNGEEEVQVEEIIDPAVINVYMRHIQKLQEESMRIQNLLAKLKRNQERRQQRNAARLAESDLTENTLPSRDKKPEPVRRCGKCGGRGHMKTNRKCPKFNEEEDLTSSDLTVEQEPVIKMEGTRISISKALVEK
ncbi:9352_t:CDS:10 [Ambispora gerdemannii]|uniref:9352_t:CDS:1 n=1 Tax=Ambispora gerdemannii TaxID=144530 RepID=A0A9N8VPX9_9GLOM|nr:9352_t:CDS:10 [Ambispora gerdemannii]